MFPRCANAGRKTSSLVMGLAWLFLAPPTVFALSLHQLEQDDSLTPKKFSRLFHDFEYVLLEQIQPPEIFLRDRRGDCGDYACLADLVLKPKGYDTRLVQIRLVGQVSHAVCYVVGREVYLDYNNRSVFFTLTKCEPNLRTVAQKVARSLRANWTTAYEFEYSYERDRKRVTSVVVRAHDAAKDPKPWQPGVKSHRDNPFSVD